MSENNNGWTIAYRKPRANRFIRPTNFTGTWAQAKALASVFAEANPEMQVYYVPSREAELAGAVAVEDIANVLVDSGKRVRIVEQGEVGAELIARVPAADVAQARWIAGETIAEPAPERVTVSAVEVVDGAEVPVGAPRETTMSREALDALRAEAPAAPARDERLVEQREQVASMTFPYVGEVKGSNVWRNRGTGVEIIKGKNFAEVGLYYVCVPTAPRDHDGRDGRRVVAHRTTFAEARRVAQGRAYAWRSLIAQAYTPAHLEDSDRAGEQLAQLRDWMNRHELLTVPGHLLADATLAAIEADRAEAVAEDESRPTCTVCGRSREICIAEDEARVASRTS